MSAACQGFIADNAADTEAAVICSVSARASVGDMAANHLPASPGRNLWDNTSQVSSIYLWITDEFLSVYCRNQAATCYAFQEDCKHGTG